MDRRSCRQIQLVGDVADLGEHGVGPEVAEGELLVCPRSQRSLHVRLELEVDLVSNTEDAFKAFLVSLLLHSLLSSEEVLSNKIKHCSTISEHGVDIRN